MPTEVPPSAAVTPAAAPPATEPLRSSGPYLAYYQERGDDVVLVLRDADAGGASTLALPGEALLAELPGSISPDGEWLVIYTGSAGEFSPHGIGEGPFDLALSLMHLPDGEIHGITPLLSEDYPINFVRSANELSPRVDYDGSLHPRTPEELASPFLAGILAHDWSPTGRYLAFAGEMDGPSSDLYVFDTATEGIRRLTSGPEFIQSIWWSPDGEWIAHSSALEICMGVCETWWAVRADGARVVRLPDTDNGTMGWLEDDEFSLWTGANGLGAGYLRTVNVETGEIRQIWPHQFDGIALDRVAGLIGVATSGWEDDLPAGFYLYNPATAELNRLLQGRFMWTIDSWGNGEYSFLVTDDDLGTVAVRPDGTYATISPSPKWPAVSPDAHWVALRSAHTQPGLQLYTPDGRILIVSDHTARSILWRPDSAGLFYATETELFYVPLNSPHPMLVDSGLLDPYRSPPAWAP